MYKLALYGSPHIQHSLSPQLHQYAAQLTNIDVDYQLIPCHAHQFSKYLELNTHQLLGANVTNPHKIHAYQACDHLSIQALQTQAVNTLIWQQELVYGDNTDVYGFLKGLEYALLRKKYALTLDDIESILIIGTGGVTRAVLSVLSDMDKKKIHIIARSQSSIDRLQQHQSIMQNDHYYLLANSTSLSSLKFDLVILATPPLSISFYDTILTDIITYSKPFHPLIYDLNYGQRSQISQQWAETLALDYSDGLMMLVAQGLSSFQQWTGHQVDEDLVYQHLKAIL